MLATTLTLATTVNCIGICIGLQRGTHSRWEMVANDGTAAPPLTDMGASLAIATAGVLTLFIAAPPNGSSVWVRAVNEVSGAVFEQEITADLPANAQFLSLSLFMNNWATAAAVAYGCTFQPSEARSITASSRMPRSHTGTNVVQRGWAWTICRSLMPRWQFTV